MRILCFLLCAAAMLPPARANTFKETAKDMSPLADVYQDAVAATGRMVCGPSRVHPVKYSNGSATLTVRDNIITLSRHQVFENPASGELLCKRTYFAPDYGQHPARRIEIKLTAACAAKFCGKATASTDVFDKYEQDWCVFKLPVHITRVRAATLEAQSCPTSPSHVVAGYAVFSQIAKGKRKITGAECRVFDADRLPSAMPQLLKHDCSTLEGSSGGGLYEICERDGALSSVLQGIHVGGFAMSEKAHVGEPFDIEKNANVAVALTGPVKRAIDLLAASGEQDLCSIEIDPRARPYEPN
jgi:hypothetical protein